MARELTKVHEQVVRGSIDEVLAVLEEDLKGEVVLVLDGASTSSASLSDAILMARRLVEEGMTKSKAAAQAASAVGVPRRAVYEGLLEPT
jgi:16S rRNA (cytidine1402-2'-O)-methyltransferase